MGRGVSAGGGQSSLGYLFGNGEPANNSPVAKNVGNSASSSPSPKPASASPPIDKQTPAGIHGNLTNNYYRADGQNCGNFITVMSSLSSYSKGCLMSLITSCDFFYFGD